MRLDSPLITRRSQPHDGLATRIVLFTFANNDNTLMCRYPTDADIQYHLHMFESILKGIAQKVSKAVDRVPELLVECDYINYALRRGVGPFPLERMTLRGVPPATPKKKKKSTKRSKSSDLKRPTQATTLFDICIERVQHNLYIYLTLFTLYGYILRPRKES